MVNQHLFRGGRHKAAVLADPEAEWDETAEVAVALALVEFLVVALIGVVFLVGALNFLPALALGPIVEHFLMYAGKLF